MTSAPYPTLAASHPSRRSGGHPPRDWTGEDFDGAHVLRLLGTALVGHRWPILRSVWELSCRCGTLIERSSVQLQDARRKGKTFLCPACLREEAARRIRRLQAGGRLPGGSAQRGERGKARRARKRS